ncbi:MAG: NUDIX domain-containing protein [Actinomycetota bacterium]
MSGQHFRAGVVIVVRHPDRCRVMVFERSDGAGSWQLPQGGLDAGEEPLAGAWRELREETGLGPDDVKVVAEHPDWIAYEWTPDIMEMHGRAGKRRGQVQKWFFFDVLRPDVEPSPDGSEFVAWQWVEPTWLIDHVPEFRRAAYAKVLGTA